VIFFESDQEAALRAGSKPMIQTGDRQKKATKAAGVSHSDAFSEIEGE
jgi:hypothetical protein